MTSREMQISFIKELTNIDKTIEYPNLPGSDIIFYFINLAQDRYLKEKYIIKSISDRDSIEFLRKRLDDLKQLITRKLMFNEIIALSEPTTAITPGTLYSSEVKSASDGGLLFPLPTDYIYYVKSSSKMSGTYLSKSTKTWFENKIIDHLDLTSNLIINSVNYPIIRNPLILLEKNPSGTTLSDSYLVLYKDSYSNLFNIEITYIRQPKTIVLVVSDSDIETAECELTSSTHQEIVSYAARMYIEEYKYKLSIKQ